MSQYLAAYDIANHSQREKVARFLMRFGTRLQWSVFEIFLDPEELEDFRRGIGMLLGKNDEFDLIPIDTHPHRTRLRWQKPLENYPGVILGPADSSQIRKNSDGI